MVDRVVAQLEVHGLGLMTKEGAGYISTWLRHLAADFEKDHTLYSSETFTAGYCLPSKEPEATDAQA